MDARALRIAPSAPFASESIRLVCRSSPNTSSTNSRALWRSVGAPVWLMRTFMHQPTTAPQSKFPTTPRLPHAAKPHLGETAGAQPRRGEHLGVGAHPHHI